MMMTTMNDNNGKHRQQASKNARGNQIAMKDMAVIND